MAVNLSPLGGVAAQFFDNNGVILSGGKIYTYAAGTTTNQATYTSASGATAQANPIILDSAGRVPSGEIWLTDGLQYKFVIKNSNDVTIGTYDNIIGINSNFVNFLTETEIQTATAGQTVFTLNTMEYQPGTNNLSVFVDGVNQYDGVSYSYVETNSTTVTFTAGLHVGALVKFTTAQTLSTGVTDASLVTYNPPFLGGVETTVENELAQNISVKDFGAVGDGVTDDTDAFENAISYVLSTGRGANINIPPGIYQISRSLTLEPNGTTLTRNIAFVGQGDGNAANPSVMLRYVATSSTDPTSYQNGLFNLISTVGISFEKICFFNNATGVNQLIWIHAENVTLLSAWKTTFNNCSFQNTATDTKELSNGHVYFYNALDIELNQCWFFGSPINATLGIDPNLSSGVASGFTGRVQFNNAYFTGDVILYRTNITNFSGCTIAEKWDNPSPFTLGAKIHAPDTTYTSNYGLNIIGCQFEGLFNAGSPTGTAIVLEKGTRASVIQGCYFSGSYGQGIELYANTTGVSIISNYFVISGSPRNAIYVDSGFKGSIDVSNNQKSSSLITMLDDNRPYSWPYLVKLNAATNYTITAGNTWETAYSSSAVSYAAGWYRVTATALTKGQATAANIGVRVTNSAGFTSTYESFATSYANGAVSCVTTSELVYLEAGTSVTWNLQAREQTNSGGQLQALGLSGTPSTYLHVEWVA